MLDLAFDVAAKETRSRFFLLLGIEGWIVDPEGDRALHPADFELETRRLFDLDRPVKIDGAVAQRQLVVEKFTPFRAARDRLADARLDEAAAGSDQNSEFSALGKHGDRDHKGQQGQEDGSF